MTYFYARVVFANTLSIFFRPRGQQCDIFRGCLTVLQMFLRLSVMKHKSVTSFYHSYLAWQKSPLFKKKHCTASCTNCYVVLALNFIGHGLLHIERLAEMQKLSLKCTTSFMQLFLWILAIHSSKSQRTVSILLN